MTDLEQELSQILDMTELEERLCKIYVLADKIVHEPTIGVWPKAVSKSHVSGYAFMIRECIIDAMDHLDRPPRPCWRPVATPQ